MRANPQTHAGITLPDEIWVSLDELEESGVDTSDLLAAVRRVGEGEQAKLAALLTALGSPLTKRRMRLGRSKKRSAAFDRLYERILNAQEVVTIDDIAEMFSMPTESEWLDLIDDYAADACAEIAATRRSVTSALTTGRPRNSVAGTPASCTWRSASWANTD